MRKLFELLIRLQEAIPINLPNRYLVWRSYGKKFSKTCDVCHDERGIYKITGRDPKIPRTVLIPIPVRMCTECMCTADEKVGIMSEKEEEGESIKIERI